MPAAIRFATPVLLLAGMALMTGRSHESLTGVAEDSEDLASSSSMGTLLSDSEGAYSAISAHFNGTPIKAGSYLWCTAVIQQESVEDEPVTIHVGDRLHDLRSRD